MAEDWLTVRQAADLVNYHIEHIRRLIRAGKVKARRLGPLWLVSRTDLLAYVRRAEKWGEKRGPKPGG